MVSEASFSYRRTKEDARDAVRCGARVRKKRSPALTHPGEGSPIDRGSSGRMCAKSARSPSIAQVSLGGRPGLRSSSRVVGGGPLGRTSRVFLVFFLEIVKKYAASRARRVRAIPHHKELRSLRLRTKTKTKTKQKQNKNQPNQKVTPVQNA